MDVTVVGAKGESKVLLSIPRLELARGTSTTIVITGSNRLDYFTFIDAPIPNPAKD